MATITMGWILRQVKLVVLFGVYLFLALGSMETDEEEARRAARTALYNEVKGNLEISRWNYYTLPMSDTERESILNKIDGRTHNLFASFTIVNNSQYSVKDFVVTFDLAGNSGTHVQTISTDPVLEIVPANGSKRIENRRVGAVKIGEGKFTCKITSFEVIE